MFKLTVKVPDLDDPIELETEERPLARATEQLLKANGYEVETSIDVPASKRVVKFKGVD